MQARDHDQFVAVAENKGENALVVVKTHEHLLGELVAELALPLSHGYLYILKDVEGLGVGVVEFGDGVEEEPFVVYVWRCWGEELFLIFSCMLA